MPSRSIVLLMCLSLPSAAVVIDRIAVIVDNRVIKASDIERDIRVTEFLNRTPLDTSGAMKKSAAERLIDQTVIREDMEKGGYSKSTDAEVDELLKRIRDERFGGSDTRLQQELTRYGLTEPQLRLQLQWQSDVLSFLDQRFRPGVIVTDDQVKSYYQEHRTSLEHQFPSLKTYDELEPKIRASLEGEQLNKNFETWLAAARKRRRIEYRQEAFR